MLYKPTVLCLNRRRPDFQDPVHTTPFTNENGLVLFRFRKDLRPHLLYPYRFRPPTLQRVSALKTRLNLRFSYILPPTLLHYFPREN